MINQELLLMWKLPQNILFMSLICITPFYIQSAAYDPMLSIEDEDQKIPYQTYTQGEEELERFLESDNEELSEETAQGKCWGLNISVLQEALKVKAEEKKLQCKLCGKKFRRDGWLSRHLKQHEKDRKKRN